MRESASMMQSDETLDVKGLLCPLPVLKAQKKLRAMASGAVLVLEATDPASVIDVPHFCNESGHRLIGQEDRDGTFVFRIERA